MGVCLGQIASGEGANNVESVQRTPQASRETSVRELFTFLSAPRHAGFPPKKSTDAPFGIPRMGHQGSQVAFKLGEADKFLFVRLVGPTSRAHSAT